MIVEDSLLLNVVEKGIQTPHNPVKELVHQLWLLFFRHIDDGFEAFAGEPAGFGVGAAAAGEYEDADIGPKHGVQVGLEAFLGDGVGQVLDVLGRLPVLPVFIYVGPVEAAGVVFGIAEVIDLVAGFPQRGHHFGLVWVPPAGGDVDSGPELSFWFVRSYE